MAPVDAFLAISKLLTELTERIKDGKTSALVQQVQSNYQAIQASYFSAEKRAKNFSRHFLHGSRNLLLDFSDPEAVQVSSQGFFRSEVGRFPVETLN